MNFICIINTSTCIFYSFFIISYGLLSSTFINFLNIIPLWLFLNVFSSSFFLSSDKIFIPLIITFGSEFGLVSFFSSSCICLVITMPLLGSISLIGFCSIFNGSSFISLISSLASSGVILISSFFWISVCLFSVVSFGFSSSFSFLSIISAITLFSPCGFSETFSPGFSSFDSIGLISSFFPVSLFSIIFSIVCWVSFFLFSVSFGSDVSLAISLFSSILFGSSFIPSLFLSVSFPSIISLVFISKFCSVLIYRL